MEVKKYSSFSPTIHHSRADSFNAFISYVIMATIIIKKLYRTADLYDSIAINITEKNRTILEKNLQIIQQKINKRLKKYKEKVGLKCPGPDPVLYI